MEPRLDLEATGYWNHGLLGTIASRYSYEWKPEAEKFGVARSQGWEPLEYYARLRHEVMHEL